MQRLLRLAVLICTFVLVPVLGIAQQTGAKGGKVDEVQLRSKLVAGTFIEGKLTAADVEGEDKKITVSYTHQIKTLNVENSKKIGQLIAQARGIRDRNSAQFKQLQEQYNAAKAAEYDIQEIPITFECVTDKAVIVRTLAVPMGDDGKPKKLTPAEEKALKGPDAKQEGYKAELKDLDPGEQVVRIFLDKSKLKAAPAAPKKDDKKDAKKDDAEKKDAEKTEEVAVVYPITKIVIVPPKENTAGVGAGPANPFFQKK
jgi:hypothetical protein